MHLSLARLTLVQAPPAVNRNSATPPISGRALAAIASDGEGGMGQNGRLSASLGPRLPRAVWRERVRGGMGERNERLRARTCEPVQSSPGPAPHTLWGSRSRHGSVTCEGQPHKATGHDRRRVAAPALSDPRPVPQLAVAARPYLVVQEHRAARATPRGRHTPQNQPEASPGLARPRRIRRTDPTATRGAARSSAGHPGHGVAAAPPPGDQEADLPARAPSRPATSMPSWLARGSAR
jgi:hypothetical protein